MRRGGGVVGSAGQVQLDHERRLVVLESTQSGLYVPTFQNSFANGATAYTGVTRQRIGSRYLVSFSGCIDVTSATTGNVAFNLPEDYRPPHEKIYICPNGGNGGAGNYHRVTVAADGDVTLDWTGTVGSCYLDVIHFWTDL